MPKVVEKRSRITESWSYRHRTIRGKKTLVKVRKVGGKEQVRMAGVVDTTDKEEVRRETVEVMLGELKGALDKEFQAIDALDRKGGIIFGSASLVVALMTIAHAAFFQKALEPSCASICLQVGFVIGGLVYVGIICCMIRAFKVTTYYLPVKLDAEEIQKGYLGLDKAAAREQLLANYIEYSGINSTIIDKKARWVEISLRLLGADVAYLTILVIVGTFMVFMLGL